MALTLASNPDPYKAPEPYRPPAPAYRPAPYKPTPYKEEKLPPQPFAYEYGVRDEYTGADYDKKEQQDAYGNLNGEYRVNLPDGRVQIVTYTANHDDGFVADVRYEGEAVYPPEPKEGYGYKPPQPAPAYKPRPAPAYPKPAPQYS